MPRWYMSIFAIWRVHIARLARSIRPTNYMVNYVNVVTANGMYVATSMPVILIACAFCRPEDLCNLPAALVQIGTALVLRRQQDDKVFP